MPPAFEEGMLPPPLGEGWGEGLMRTVLRPHPNPLPEGEGMKSVLPFQEEI